jgi:hypothetical protein
MVGAGKMGVQQQPWMQHRVKDGIEMHGQRRLWRWAFGGVGTHTDNGAEAAALEKDTGMVGGDAQGRGPCRDTRKRRCWGHAFEAMEAVVAGRIGDGVVEGHKHGSDFFHSYRRTHVKLSQLEGS